MAAAYRGLAEHFGERTDIVIAQMNADLYREFTDHFGITGYPMLKLFRPGSLVPENFDCRRDLASMRDYAEKILQQKS